MKKNEIKRNKTKPTRTKSGPAKTAVSTINVVPNKSVQSVENILRPNAEGAFSPPALHLVENRFDHAVEEVARVTPKSVAEQGARLQCGLRIVDNRSHQRPQKIKNTPIEVLPSDEMIYKRLFSKFEEAFLGRDMRMLAECLSPAFEWRLPNGEVIYGKKQALDEMERRFALPNGPKFSRSVWRFRGKTVIQTYRVKYLGPDGKWRKSRGMDLYKIRLGLISRKDAYWKMIP